MPHVSCAGELALAPFLCALNHTMQGRQRFASQSLVTCGSELNIGVPSANLQSKMRKTKQLGKNTTQHKKILINAKHGQIIFFLLLASVSHRIWTTQNHFGLRDWIFVLCRTNVDVTKSKTKIVQPKMYFARWSKKKGQIFFCPMKPAIQCVAFHSAVTVFEKSTKSAILVGFTAF